MAKPTTKVPKPIPFASVKRKGAAKPASGARIAKAFATELPPSYVELLALWGAGTFARTLDIPDAAWVVRWTKAFQKKWTDAAGRVFFTDYDEKLGEGRGMRLIDIGRSPGGDRLCFVSGEPDALYILPRSESTITIAKDMPAALAWFFAKARNVDPNTALAYVVGR